MKPKPLAELLIKKISPRILEIWYGSSDAHQWILREAVDYGEIGESTNSRPILYLTVDSLYDPDDVLRYLLSYLEDTKETTHAPTNA